MANPTSFRVHCFLLQQRSRCFLPTAISFRVPVLVVRLPPYREV
jgi:hypothetical protein